MAALGGVLILASFGLLILGLWAVVTRPPWMHRIGLVSKRRAIWCIIASFGLFLLGGAIGAAAGDSGGGSRAVQDDGGRSVEARQPQGAQGAPTQPPPPTLTPEPSATPTPEPPQYEKKIGNLLLRVNAWSLHIDRLFPAEPGTHYIAVDITARNVGSGTYSLNRFNFRLKDSDGYTNEPALTDGPDPQIGHHDLVPEQEVRGFIVFKVGDGREPVELQYRSFTGTPGTISLLGLGQ